MICPTPTSRNVNFWTGFLSDTAKHRQNHGEKTKMLYVAIFICCDFWWQCTGLCLMRHTPRWRNQLVSGRPWRAASFSSLGSLAWLFCGKGTMVRDYLTFLVFNSMICVWIKIGESFVLALSLSQCIPLILVPLMTNGRLCRWSGCWTCGWTLWRVFRPNGTMIRASGNRWKEMQLWATCQSLAASLPFSFGSLHALLCCPLCEHLNIIQMGNHVKFEQVRKCPQLWMNHKRFLLTDGSKTWKK